MLISEVVEFIDSIFKEVQIAVFSEGFPLNFQNTEHSLAESWEYSL